jgi:ATP-dependent protease ClpP protease subunit
MPRTNKTAEILIYEDIGEAFGGITPKDFAAQLRQIGPVDTLAVRINSAGGSVWDGFTIYNQLRRHPSNVQVHVDGAALSIAAVIAQAAGPGQLHMAAGAMMMIHRAWSITLGGAEQFRREADLLERLDNNIADALATRSKADSADILSMMTEETWLTADQAVAAGLADQVTQAKAQAAHLDRRWLKDVPPDLIAQSAARAARYRLDEVLPAARN